MFTASIYSPAIALFYLLLSGFTLTTLLKIIFQRWPAASLVAQSKGIFPPSAVLLPPGYLFFLKPPLVPLFHPLFSYSSVRNLFHFLSLLFCRSVSQICASYLPGELLRPSCALGPTCIGSDLIKLTKGPGIYVFKAPRVMLLCSQVFQQLAHMR